MSGGRAEHPAPARVGRAALLFVAALGVAAITSHARDRAGAMRDGWPVEADLYYLPASRVMKWASLGHHELAADLVAARTNVYFGTQILAKGAQRWLERYLDTVADLDPAFQSIYDRGATMLVYDGTDVNLTSFEAANAFLRRGLAVFPDDWRLWYQLGFNELLEMPKFVPSHDPRLARWKESGTEALRRATLSPAVPGWLGNLVARRLSEDGKRDLAIEHLKRVYAVTSDEYSREQIRAKLMQLLGERHAVELEREHARLKALGAAYPYAPEAFTIIMGPRQGGAIDLPALIAPLEDEPASPPAAGSK